MRVLFKGGPSNKREFVMTEHSMGDDVHAPKITYFLHELGNPAGGGYSYSYTTQDGVLVFEWTI